MSLWPKDQLCSFGWADTEQMVLCSWLPSPPLTLGVINMSVCRRAAASEWGQGHGIGRDHCFTKQCEAGFKLASQLAGW